MNQLYKPLKMRTLKLIILIVGFATITFVMYKASTDPADVAMDKIELMDEVEDSPSETI